jgi:hypothetical protein
MSRFAVVSHHFSWDSSFSAVTNYEKVAAVIFNKREIVFRYLLTRVLDRFWSKAAEAKAYSLAQYTAKFKWACNSTTIRHIFPLCEI